MANPECKDICPLKKRCPKQLLFDEFHAFDSDKYRELSKHPENSHKFFDGQIPPAIDAYFFVTGSVTKAIREICDGPLLLGQKRSWTKYIGLGNIVKVCGADPRSIGRAKEMIGSMIAGTTGSDPNFSDSVDSDMDNEGKILVARRVPDGLGNAAIDFVREFPQYRSIEAEQGNNSPEWPLFQEP